VKIGEDGKEYVTSDRMFPDKFYQKKIFNMIDKDPEHFMKEVLGNLGFEIGEEFDILYNYFVNYDDRKSYYIEFSIYPDDISKFFDDRDYGLEELVKNYLEGDWDSMDWYNESFPYDDHMLSYINDASWKFIMKILKTNNVVDAEELVSGNIENKKLEDHYELMEDTIDDVQQIIAHSITEAQADADISYLHDDILDSINDFFLHGEFDRLEGKFIGSIELGDVFGRNSDGIERLESDLEEAYPSLVKVVHDLLGDELSEWGWKREGEYIFTSNEKPYINTDKHFRYGGAGTMNEIYFNDMLVDRLSWDY